MLIRKANSHKGRLLILAISLVAVFALGLETLLAQGTTPTPGSSTLTAIMAAKTAYAKSYPSQAVILTLAADVTHTAVQETSNPHQLDPIEMTATYIVGQATEMAAVELTSTANAIFGISLSQDTLTSVPTDTADELVQQKAEYITEMRSTIGFNHPIFDEIADELVKENWLNGRGHLQLDKRATTFDNDKYIALIIRREGDDFLLAQSFLVLFRLADKEALFLDNNLGNHMSMVFDEYGFTDWNKNELPDFAIYTWEGGNCCLPQLHIFEISSAHQIIDITPKTTDVYPLRFIDLNDDGIPEIEGESGNPGPFITRWFGWNGQAYVDISRQHPELYLTRINDFAQSIASSCVGRYGSYREYMEYYLSNFYVMGRLSDGWNELQRLLKLYCGLTDLQIKEGALKDVEQWMNSLPKS